MGYFSERAIELEASWEDRSFPSEEQSLRMRLEDLRRRLIELTQSGPDGRGRAAEASLRYVLPEDLHTAEEVRAAIALIQKDYWAACGFCLEEPAGPARAEAEEPAAGQISLHCWLPPIRRPQGAAA